MPAAEFSGTVRVTAAGPNVGARFAIAAVTVTVNDCSASPPLPSAAVTVTVALPCAFPVNPTVLPVTVTVTAVESVHSTVYDSVSPSASVKFADTSTLPLPPAATVCPPIVPEAAGARFTCRTVTVTVSTPVSEPSLTVSSNSRSVSAVTSGAVNVGPAALVSLSVAVGPAVCVHA